MDDLKRRRIGKITLLAAVIICLGLATFVLRGPHISNALKKLILPELEMMTGRKVIAQKIYINLIPFFVEAKGLKVFDEKGERFLLAQRAKAYVDLSGFFSRQLVIRRLVIRGPEVTAERKQVEEMIGTVKAYLSKKRDTALKVKVRAVEIQDGTAGLRDG